MKFGILNFFAQSFMEHSGDKLCNFIDSSYCDRFSGNDSIILRKNIFITNTKSWKGTIDYKSKNVKENLR